MRSRAKLLGYVAGYKAYRRLGLPRLMPINLVASVTNRCNSKCRTCFIWKDADKSAELTSDEYGRIFSNIGKSVFWVTLSGGEPFLRKDLAAIIGEIEANSHPSIINIPSNGILTRQIGDTVEEVLNSGIGARLIVNLSLDGVGDRHDKIRGVPGNFRKFEESFRVLKDISKSHENFQVGIHTVLSKLNMGDMGEIYSYAKEKDPDSYIVEVAEHRTELFNRDQDITPAHGQFAEGIRPVKEGVEKDFLTKPGLSKMIQALRLGYYNLVVEILRQQRQVIDCYALVASGHITPRGDLWPCCIRGYDAKVGNLRDAGYNFRKLWFGKEAGRIRRTIWNRECHCPLAQTTYTNMLLDTKTMVNVASRML